MMKRKKEILIIILILFSIENVDAKRGCCSWHDGVAGCSSSGRVICNDGTYSPSCTCTPPNIYGCIDSNAINYNSNANRDDGSCKYKHQISETIELDYTVEYQNPKNVQNGKERIIQEGQKGKKVMIYDVITDKNGTEISKEQISENVVIQPINEIILIEEIKPVIEENQNSQTNEKEKIEDNSKNISESEESNSIFPIFILIMFIFNLLKVKSNPKNFPILYALTTIHNKMIKYISYFFYFMFLFPVIIDFSIYWITKIKKNRNVI